MINQPNVAISGIGAIQKRPVVIEDAVAIRSMVYLTLSLITGSWMVPWRISSCAA